MTARYDRRTVLRRGGAALAALASTGCVGSGGDVRTVEMADEFSFAPSTVSVSAGVTVRWENVSDVAHTVTAYEARIPATAAYFASGGFASEQAARSGVSDGLVEPGESYAHTVEVPGTYEYFCVPHEGSGMVGAVRVG